MKEQSIVAVALMVAGVGLLLLAPVAAATHETAEQKCYEVDQQLGPSVALRCQFLHADLPSLDDVEEAYEAACREVDQELGNDAHLRCQLPIP